MTVSKTKNTKEKLEQTISTLVKKPNMYRVIIYNDDGIPEDFIDTVLVTIFNFDKDKATELTKFIKIENNGLVGVYTFEIAEQKIIEAKTFGVNKGYSLEFGIEKD